MQATHVPGTASPRSSRSTRRASSGAVALALIAVLVAACGGASEVDDAGTQPADTAGANTEVDEPAADTDEPATDEAPQPDPTDEDADDTSDATTDPDDADDPDTSEEAPGVEDEGDAATTRLTTDFDADEVSVLAADGSTLARLAVPDAQLDSFDDVVVRPGATATELDAIVVVLRGEVFRLYHLEVVDGETVELTEVPDHLQPQDVMESTMTLRWTPDADSVLWTEPTPEGVTLRSFGWEDGPGTDRPADDNAAFALDLPADVSIDGFEVLGDDRWTVQLIDGLGTAHELQMERQADGALALP